MESGVVANLGHHQGEEKNFEGTFYAKLTEEQDRIEKERTATSTSFWTTLEGYFSSWPPPTRRGLCSTWLPCLLDADWCLRSDVQPIHVFRCRGRHRHHDPPPRPACVERLDLGRHLRGQADCRRSVLRGAWSRLATLYANSPPSPNP